MSQENSDDPEAQQSDVFHIVQRAARPPASHARIKKARNGRRLLRGEIDQLQWTLFEAEYERLFKQSKSMDDFFNRLQEHGYQVVDREDPWLQDITEELRRIGREENQRNQAKSTEIEEAGARPQSEELSPDPRESK